MHSFRVSSDKVHLIPVVVEIVRMGAAKKVAEVNVV